MDRWPGAYPASEPPTPAQETPQQQQQPQYPAQQHSQRQPLGGLTEQPARTPDHGPLAAGIKPTDVSAGHGHKDSGVGLSNVESHPVRGRTLDDRRTPSVDEAIGGGTYAREHEGFPTGLETQPKRNVQRDESGQAAWPLSDAGVQQEQQPRKVHQYHPDEAQRVVREVQQQQVRADFSHGHQPSDLPISYQEQARDVLQQPHDLPQQPRVAQQQSHAAHGVVGLSHGHEPSDLPLAYQQNTLSQQPENLPHSSRAGQQQSQAAASEGLSRNHAPSDLPLAYQESTHSKQPEGAHQEDKSRTRAEQGLAAGALAGAGLAGYEYSSKHDELPQQTRGAQYQQGTAGLDRGNQPSDLPVAYQQQARGTSHQPGQAEQQPTQSSRSATDPPEQAGHSASPYWGSIPTAATGGIYNTVTGHGSPNDDHDQHHHLPKRDTTAEQTATDAAVPSATTSFPTGGVYNSVTGRGSGEETAGQHDTNASRVPLLGAGHTADRSTYGETGTQRAFPLATSDREGHTDDKSHSKTEQELAAGALAGAGVATYEHSGKHDESVPRDSRDVAGSQGQALTGADQRRAQAQAISPPNAEEKQKEKDHHGVFGIFHRHKDEKQEDDPKQHRRSGSSERRNTLKKSPPPKVAQAMRESTPPKNDSLEQDSKKDHKEALATGAGVAAGGVAASELAHRHADTEDRGAGNRASGPYDTLSDGTPSGIATSSTGGAAAARDSSSSAPYDNASGSNQAGRTSERSGQYDRLDDGTASGIATGAGAGGAMAASQGTKDSQPYESTQASTGTAGSEDDWRSELPPTVATTREKDTPATQGTTQGDQSANKPTTSQTTGTTRDTQSTGNKAGTTGPYDTLGSGTAPGVAAAGAGSALGASHEESSRGAKEGAASLERSHKHEADADRAEGSPGRYNVLSSGTPSGVNIEYSRKSREMER